MKKSDWQKLGLVLSVLECAFTAEHEKGKHPATNWACVRCLLRLIMNS